jgi:hypothetical protein
MLFNKRRLSELCDRFFRGRDSIVEQAESPFLFTVSFGHRATTVEQGIAVRWDPSFRRGTA